MPSSDRVERFGSGPSRAHAEETEAPSSDGVAGWPSRAHAEEIGAPSSDRVAGWRQRYLARQQRHRRLLIALQLGYVALFAVWMALSHSWPAPDLIAISMLLFALLAARGVSFVRDWSPFLVLLLGYIALTGLVPNLEQRAHVTFPIDIDRALFGGRVPTLWLQAHLYNPQQLHWYDYLSTFLYPMHFVVPLLLAFVFWMWRPKFYWRFVISYLVLCYAGFITYLLFPMAPPWWAYRVGALPPVHLILYEVHYEGLSNPIVLATQFFKPNPVAAMPSLHAALPFLVFLVLSRAWPRWGWLSIAYPLAMSFAVVYMGEHYLIDVLAGFLYAIVAYAVIWVRLPGRRRQAAVNDRPPKPAPVLAFTTRRVLIARQAARR